MNKEQIFYIQILKDFILGSKTQAVDDLDWLKLSEYALSQNTNGIVYNQCKDFIPSVYKQRFSSLYLAEVYNYGTRIALTREIVERFKENNIPYFIVKGPVVAEYYPIAALRTMGDSDFIVKQEYKDKACKIMEELGYTYQEMASNECIYYKNNLMFEIHHRLMYQEVLNVEEEIDFCANCWDYVKDNKLDDSFHFIFLIIHLKKHLIYDGIGIRQFIDLVCMAQKCKLNWDYINESLKSINLYEFKNTVEAFLYKWFGYKLEENIIDIDDDFLDIETIKILSNGVHGSNNEDNDLNMASFSMNKKQGSNNIFSRIRYGLLRYFPSYTILKDKKSFEFIIDRPYLLPIAWLKRFYLAIKNQRALNEINKSIKGMFMSNEELSKRNDAYGKWGL